MVVDPPAGPLEVHVAHLPPGVSRPEEKVATFEASYAGLSEPSARPRILCGDFNSPQSETKAGDVLTWANHHPSMYERWDAAERSVLQGLAVFDLSDVYRRVNRYQADEGSWITPSGTPRRYDHVFASKRLNPVSCGYVHGFREAGLSDHSPIEVVFEP